MSWLLLRKITDVCCLAQAWQKKGRKQLSENKTILQKSVICHKHDRRKDIVYLFENCIRSFWELFHETRVL